MRQTRELRDGWELAETDPDELEGSARLDDLDWRPALVPGTVAGARPDLNVDPDGRDWWFRLRFAADACRSDEQLILCLDGLATLSEVFLNGQPLLSSRSMFAAHELDVSAVIEPSNELAICFRALAPQLAVRRRPRARWRTALVNGNLRFFRTMLLGRAPGFAPGPAVVGPWRPVRLERRAGPVLSAVALRPRVAADGSGVLAVQLTGTLIGEAGLPETLLVSIAGPTGAHELRLEPDARGPQFTAAGELLVPGVQLWWPHTHGEPTQYEVTVSAGERELHRAHVGFRTIDWPSDWENAGLALRVNGVPVFARGAVWTPLDMTAPDQPEPVVRAALEQVVDGGMNMLRIAGIGCYETELFHDLCDELGILVWQDFMLANLDYPAGEPDWDAEFEAEVRNQLGRLAGRPSLAVLCGGSEVAQQVAMLGLDPDLARGPLYTETLPRLIAEADARVPYLPNSPWGGTLPFRPGQGVANYYGVGAYLRELSDVRLSDVKFAGECLAFSNVPDDESLAKIEAPGGLVPHHPAWKAGVPRDAGAGWDFEDVRDHYLQKLYGEDPVQLRWSDLRRYLNLSRTVTGEVMAEVFGEWRRAGSACAGGLVLWLRDLKPGAGWGVIDHTGRPKMAYHLLRRVLAPVAVWITDEGLSGMTAHVANDGPGSLEATLRVALYRDSEVRVDQASLPIELGPHSVGAYDLEQIVGHFADIGFAYRFGPPGHDVVAVSLERGAEPGSELIANAFRFPVARPALAQSAAALGLVGSIVSHDGAETSLRLRCRRLVRDVRVDAPGWLAEEQAFTLEPGVERLIALTPAAGAEQQPPAVTVTALNLRDPLRVAAVSD
ncbi:MAG TPA: hypothetical protein VHU61_15450 [Solirubrobacteraceae bacterium]|nr:hypothetical protein [Solirubrobacteraceae bacterium]